MSSKIFARTLRGAAVFSLLAMGAAHTAESPKTLTGLWLLEPKEFGDGPSREPLPLNPAGLALQADLRRRTSAVQSTLSDRSRKCLPSGMPGMMVNEFATEILETADRVAIFNEASTLPRTIYLKETEHTKGIEPSYNGHSIGHYEGVGAKRVLVVDTVNFNDKVAPIGGRGTHSPTTHLTERYYLSDPDTMVGESTFEDPTYLSRPYVQIHHYHRVQGKAELWEYACEADAPGWSERFEGDPAAKLSATK
jgi:hypothetical protein